MFTRDWRCLQSVVSICVYKSFTVLLTWLPHRLVDMMTSALCKNKPHTSSLNKGHCFIQRLSVQLQLLVTVTMWRWSLPCYESDFKTFYPSLTIRWDGAALLGLRVPCTMWSCGWCVGRTLLGAHTNTFSLSLSPPSCCLNAFLRLRPASFFLAFYDNTTFPLFIWSHPCLLFPRTEKLIRLSSNSAN